MQFAIRHLQLNPVLWSKATAFCEGKLPGSLMYKFVTSFIFLTQFSEAQKKIFESHEVASSHLIEALLEIFIDIEFTGESMEFEDKFRESTCLSVLMSAIPPTALLSICNVKPVLTL